MRVVANSGPHLIRGFKSVLCISFFHYSIKRVGVWLPGAGARLTLIYSNKTQRSQGYCKVSRDYMEACVSMMFTYMIGYSPGKLC